MPSEESAYRCGFAAEAPCVSPSGSRLTARLQNTLSCCHPEERSDVGSAVQFVTAGTPSPSPSRYPVFSNLGCGKLANSSPRKTYS